MVSNQNFYTDTKKVMDSVGESIGDSVGENVGDNVTNEDRIETLTLFQKRVLIELEKNPKLSAKELAEIVGISARRVESNIKTLKEMQYLVRVGSPKKGYWEIRK